MRETESESEKFPARKRNEMEEEGRESRSELTALITFVGCS